MQFLEQAEKSDLIDIIGIIREDWKEKAKIEIDKYNKKILDILQETGESGVIPLIEGLQERIKNLEKTIINKRSKNQKGTKG